MLEKIGAFLDKVDNIVWGAHLNFLLKALVLYWIVSHLLRIHQDRAQQSLCSYPIILMCLFPVAAQDLFVPLSKTQKYL